MKEAEDGSRVVIISEPGPNVSAEKLAALTNSVFGSDMMAPPRRLRWYIGTDGWVEDLVLQVKGSAGDDPTKDGVLRDQTALLHKALFGTNYGGTLELISDPAANAPGPASPNLHVSPREIDSWLSDKTRVWSPVDTEDDQASTWDSLCAKRSIGTFSSNDNTLVLLTFPTDLLLKLRSNPEEFVPLRIPFREFAVASDDLIGGIWTKGGQAGVLARVRTQSLSKLPPLRFETFSLLAAQSADELSQSYERNTIFAGKLGSEPHRLKDWAPVYLSAALIDTEFGALLNITDQILKSWSEAGAIEYLYFTYQKPKTFPFKVGTSNTPSPLSNVLRKAEGSRSVLFNWNTAGSGVIVQNASWSTLAVKQTGSLPVTYGADAKTKNEGGKDLYNYEEQAYNYFAGLGDPNLTRVVQYTMLYQFFRAVAKDTPSLNEPRDQTRPTTPIPARTKATDVLVRETASLLNDVDSGKFSSSTYVTQQLIPRLTAFRQAHPNIDNGSLSRMLVDRFSAEANTIRSSYFADLQKKQKALVQHAGVLEKDVDQFNSDVRLANSTFGQSLQTLAESLKDRRADLDRREAALKAQEAELERSASDPIDEIRTRMSALASDARNLNSVRQAYIDSNKAEPHGSIKTPSVVLSWNRRELLSSVGGHNVNARALRLERSSDVVGISVIKGHDGEVVLKYNPSVSEGVEGHASELARAVEHRGEYNVDALKQIASEPIPIRTPREALELSSSPAPEVPSRRSSIHLGGKVYNDRNALVDDLRTMAGKHTCCVFVARDADQTAFVAEQNLHAPPPVLTYEVRDTPSLVEHLAIVSKRSGSKDGKAVIFFDEPEAHVKALTLGLSNAMDNSNASETLAASFGPRLSGSSRRTSGLMQKDLEGRGSFMRSLKEVLGARGREVLERLGVIEPAARWRQAKVVEMDQASLEAIVADAGWDKTRDGLPTAIKVSFGSGSGGELPPDVSVIAGFEPGGDGGNDRANLLTAHNKTLERASVTGASLGQYLMTVRNKMKEMSQGRLKRLILVAHDDKETRTLFTQLRLTGDASGGS